MNARKHLHALSQVLGIRRIQQKAAERDLVRARANLAAKRRARETADIALEAELASWRAQTNASRLDVTMTALRAHAVTRADAALTAAANALDDADAAHADREADLRRAIGRAQAVARVERTAQQRAQRRREETQLDELMRGARS
jgi:hypothetical protein